MGKKHKEKKKKKEKRRKHSSSSSDSDSCEWVEKKVEIPNSKSDDDEKKQKPIRDEWMDMSNIFPCVSNDELKKAKRKEKDSDNSSSAIISAPGQSDRESNPYWKNGGTGLPSENKETSTNTVDVNWLKKSLKRAEEYAREEGKSLEEVAAERWGSLDKIKQMIREAEMQSNSNKKGYEKGEREEYKYQNQRKSYRDRSRERRRRSRSRSRERYDIKDQRKKPSFKKPSYDDEDDVIMKNDKGDQRNDYFRHRNKYDNDKSRPSFKKPTDNDDDYSSKNIGTSFSRSSKNWQKPKYRQSELNNQTSISKEEFSSKKETHSGSLNSTNDDVVLSEEEMNLLGAKIVKAEIMGKTELAAQLKEKLEKARQNRKQANENKDDNVVILTKTDNKGNMRYLETRNEEPSSTRKKKRADTHENQQRVRYFADDDKYSLQQMYVSAKDTSNHDDEAVFTKLMSKNTDLDEIFEEQIAREGSSAKQQSRERDRAIKEHQTMQKSLDNCNLCILSNRTLTQKMISSSSKIYLSLHPTTSIVKDHCILSTVSHIPCQVQLDEDYWEELTEYKQKLIKLFAKRQMEPIFFEIYINRNKFPHMKVECVPLPSEEASMAPFYFKKALLECETEWAVNKKLVEYKNLQKSIPKGLPYFAVDFGLNNGFAHVIEDEKLFSRNFAYEIIGGILDIDASVWRKPKKQNFDEIVDNAHKLQEEWLEL